MVDTRAEKGSGFDGEHRVIVPERVLASALREQPLLRGLLAAGAGYFPKAAGHLRRRSAGTDQTILIYCVKGNGWCELEGRLHTVRSGDLLVLPARAPHTYGAHPSDPWTIHWAHLAGNLTGAYLEQLGASVQRPTLPIGEDLQLTLLFNEVVRNLERGCSFPSLLHASHALAHVLALLIEHRHARGPENSDVVQKVAQCIVYMSQHVSEPLRITALAALANLSPAHFTASFKAQTGCSPRDYLHLLRIHEACKLLQRTALPVKNIAAQLGYQDQFHFSRQFKAFQGISPSQYRGAAPREAQP